MYNPKRTKTPTKNNHPKHNTTQFNLNHQKSSTKQNKQVKQIKQNNTMIQSIPVSTYFKKPLNNIGIFRQNCQSPGLTTSYTNRNVNDLQQSLKIALQLAQHHRRQVQQHKKKIQQLTKKVQQQNQIILKQNKQKQELDNKQNKIYQLQSQIEQLNNKYKILQDKNNKYEQKYKKLKVKYKQLKKQQQNNQQKFGKVSHISFSIPNTGQNIRQPAQIQQTLQTQNSNSLKNPSHNQTHTNNNIAQVSQQYKEILRKNKTIHILCEQLYQYQQNSQNILRLISILQQRIQQLSMDNNLMKKVIRKRQISQQTQDKDKDNYVYEQMKADRKYQRLKSNMERSYHLQDQE